MDTAGGLYPLYLRIENSEWFRFRQVAQQLVLGAARAALGRAQRVTAVGVHVPGLDVVAEVGIQAFLDDAPLELVLENREADLDAAEEIPLHPVGARKVDPVAAAVMKIEYPRMFEEAADHRADPDVVGEAGHAGAQDADAADDQVDGDAGLAGLVERGDGLGLDQGVHLGDDAARAALARRRGFAANGGEQARMQSEWRLPEVAQAGGLAEAGDFLEEVADVLADFLVAGQQAEVGVEPRRARMVVAGAEMDVAAVAAFFAAQHHQHLAVRLDAEDAGIVGGLQQQLDHRAEGLERMMQQDVLLADGGEDVEALGQDLGQAGAEG